MLGAIAFSYIHVYFRTWIDPVVAVRKRPAACLDNSHLSAIFLLRNDLLLEFILDKLLAHEHFLLAHVLLSRNFRGTWLETTIDVILSAFYQARGAVLVRGHHVSGAAFCGMSRAHARS